MSLCASAIILATVLQHSLPSDSDDPFQLYLYGGDEAQYLAPDGLNTSQQGYGFHEWERSQFVRKFIIR